LKETGMYPSEMFPSTIDIQNTDASTTIFINCGRDVIGFAGTISKREDA
jgi:hypothetical protein